MEQAFLLHRQSFRETSVLATFWCENLGLVKAVVKGVHGQSQQKAQRNAWLQPFQPLFIECLGARELKQVYKFEPAGPGFLLQRSMLMAGLYVNEITLTALNQYEPERYFFEVYRNSLEFLGLLSASVVTASSTQLILVNRQLAVALRQFEQQLLESIGFSIDWSQSLNGSAIQKSHGYRFKPGEGFELTTGDSATLITGDLLESVAHQQWSVPKALATARVILRQQLEFCFGRALKLPQSSPGWS